MSKNFLVTGAARGIGRGLSRLLLQKGYRVLLVDNNQSELENTVQLLSQNFALHKDFQAATCDLSNPDEIRTIVVGATDLFDGKLDCLINNAADTRGVGGWKFEDMKFEDWEKALAVNLTAPMLLSQLCLPLLQNCPNSSIIHISSTRSFMSEPNNEAYSTTKAGLLGLSQSMAVSLASYKIRVNAILPGWINVANESGKGESWEEGLSKEDHEWHLTGRVGKVEDVLRAVEYLVENEGVSGTEMVVDGGVSRKMVYPE